MFKYLLIWIVGVMGVILFLLYNPNMDIGLPKLPSKNSNPYGTPSSIQKIYSDPLDMSKIDLRKYKSMSGELVEYESWAVLHLWLKK